MPRGDGAVQVSTTSNSSARSADSISAGSRPAGSRPPGYRCPAGSKSSKNTADAGVGAGRVVRAVDDDERLVAEHLEPARHRDRRRSPRRSTSSATGAAKNASTAVERDATRCRPGGAPCSGTNTSVYTVVGVRRSTTRPPSASWFSSTSKSLAAHERRRSPGVGEDLDEVGVGLTDHHGAAPGLTMPGLLAGDVGLASGRRTRCGPCRCW